MRAARGECHNMGLTPFCTIGSALIAHRLRLLQTYSSSLSDMLSDSTADLPRSSARGWPPPLDCCFRCGAPGCCDAAAVELRSWITANLTGTG